MAHFKAYYSGKIGIWDKKPAFEEVKTGIHDKKPAFEVLITELKLSKSTRNNIEKLHTAFTEGTAFGRNDMRELTGLGESATSDLIKKMLKYGLIEKAEGRGKYRFTL